MNAFCYSGGFSVYAQKAGATLIDSVDISGKAVELCDQNIALNAEDSSNHRSFKADVLKYMQENTETYDVMVVDPPAFAKSLKKNITRCRVINGSMHWP